MKQFSILITTKNRINDLTFTLKKINHLICHSQVETIIYDDGSNDGTYQFLNKNYKNVTLFRNKISKGLIFCRNQMLNYTSANYSISLDDDAHFISEDILGIIESFFNKHTKCAIGAFRIYWGEEHPVITNHKSKKERVRGFVGCGHVWNMKAWRDIPDYPSWFIFYGEEEFASYQLFKNDWEIYYIPDLLVHHRVNLKSRKKNKDYIVRTRRSLRSGWYLYFLFYPILKIPKSLMYSIMMQFKLKILKGDMKVFIALLMAIGDVIINLPRLVKNSNRLTLVEFKNYFKLTETKIYWTPYERE